MSGLESEELRVRQSILYTVGRICDDEAQKQQSEHHARSRPAMSKEAMALLADLVYKQSEVMATELQFFARHANRKIIKTEDVTLCARKHPNLTNMLLKYQRETLNSTSTSSASSKKRRRNFRDSD
ncbi:Apoptosis-inducing TAF9-like domain 1 family protein [Phytophthora cinnamomi]|uniref:Apoptosis-inducing TAF9-like domain 1 family protein n=1 Tax=Phytophthora cinnamomi TaxID=4785 RepID=UPI003559D7CD|nr:Apoptosis-inducing TAF9-like domain 1 family protein [Phytophthora cinnamomi]